MKSSKRAKLMAGLLTVLGATLTLSIGYDTTAEQPPSMFLFVVGILSFWLGAAWLILIAAS